jgi:D-hexose-6-phosphate mutarotase
MLLHDDWNASGHARSVAHMLWRAPPFLQLVLVHPSAKASVEVYLHGATVTSWKILDQELLYLSPTAIFAPGKAIRGGVPVGQCFTNRRNRCAGDTF